VAPAPADDAGDTPAVSSVVREDWMLAPPVRPVVDKPADPREEEGKVEKFKVRTQLAVGATFRLIKHC